MSQASHPEVTLESDARRLAASESAGLFVGISTFQDSLFLSIDHAVDDAVDLAHFFALELRLIAPERCVLALTGEARKSASQKRLQELLNAGALLSDASFTNLYRQIDRQCQAATEKGLLVVSLATHGMSDQGKPLLGAADTIRLRPVKTSVQVSDLIDAISRSGCPRRLLLVDSCRGRISAQSRDTETMSPNFAEAVAKVRGTAVLSAAAEGGKAFDDPSLGNGVFTHFVLGGLRGAAQADAHGFVTARSLGDFVQRSIVHWVAINRPEIAAGFQGIACHFDGPSHELPLAYFPERRQAPQALGQPLGDKEPAPKKRRKIAPFAEARIRGRGQAGSPFQGARWLGFAASAGLVITVITLLLTRFISLSSVGYLQEPSRKVESLSWLETIFKALGSSLGTWSVAAFALGIFFLITTAVIKKARPGRFDGQQTYQFFRLAMVLAFLLALAGLVVATIREGMAHPAGPTSQEKIKSLALQLKSEDPSVRRQASDALIHYGGEAADELVLVIREEAGQVASELIGKSTSGDWSVLFAGLLGAEPWKTTFLNSAARTLAAIGEPAVPAIFDGLASDSVEFEEMIAENANKKLPEKPNLAESLGQLGTMMSLAGAGMRISIARETLASALDQMDPAPVGQLLDGLENPRTLVQLTSYQILVGKPEARTQTIERMKQIASKSESKKRDQILSAIRQLESKPG